MQRCLSVVLFGLMSGVLAGATSTAALRLEQSAAKPGGTVWAGLHLVIPKPWHTYWVNHGGVGEAPSIQWQLPLGVTAGKIHWPLPRKHLSFGSIAYVYEHEVLLLVPLKLAADLKPGALELKATAKWLECTDVECVQGESAVSARLMVGVAGTLGADARLFKTWRERLPEAKQRVIQAEWAGPVAENLNRPLAFGVPVEDAKARVVFYPYLDPGEKFMVQADVKVERGDGFAKLTQQVEFSGKDWPVEFPGVMRVGDSSYEVLLKVVAPPVVAQPKPPGNPFQIIPGVDPFGGAEGSELSLLLDAAQAKPGTTVMAGVRFKIPSGWHVFYMDPGGPGLPPELRWRLPKGITAGKIQWPAFEKYESDGETFNVYHGEVMLLVPLTLDKTLAPGEHKIRLLANWQECEKICVQYDADKTTTLLVGDASEPSAAAQDIAAWRAKILNVEPTKPVEPIPPVQPETPVDPDPLAGLNLPGAESKVTLLLDADEAPAGHTIHAGVLFKIPAKWHIFWKYPGELGEAPRIFWELPAGVTAGEIRWPQHEEYEAFGVKQNVYHDEVMLIVPLHLAEDLTDGAKEISARVTWQECEVSCVQGEATVRASLQVGATHKPSADTPVIAAWRDKVPGFSEGLGQLGWFLLLAFGGGLILNLMPCVLPVIALKVMGFVNQRQESPGHARRLGLLYGAGVVFSFLVMAVALLVVRSGAGGETWGMQMQNQWFLLFLAGLMTLVSLNLFGVFEISLGGRTMTAADSVARREGGVGAFANGMLMVALATPCMAPMLGTAIPFALTQPAGITLLVFVAVATGLALPYMVLSFKPNWLRFLPQPGAWMESFKKVMGFPMLAAAVWLMMLAGNHFAGVVDKGEGMLRVTLMLAMLAMAAWIFGEFIQRGTRRRALAGVMALACVGAGFGCLFVFQDQLDWKPWSKQAVAEARAKGHPVLVDFTADWCLTCKMNKRRSIEVDAVRKKIAETHAVVFKADFTRKDPVMADFIKSNGRAGVPLVLVYSPRLDEDPKVLPEDLTLTGGPSVVIEALEKAAASGDVVKKPDQAVVPRSPLVQSTENNRTVSVANGDQTAENNKTWQPGQAVAPQSPVAHPTENNQTADNNQTRPPNIPKPLVNAIAWSPWSPEAIAVARAVGKPVLVDFTADWCAPCKYIERTAINIPSVRRKLAVTGAVALKADFTQKNPVILREMQRFGRPGPPLVLLYPAGENTKPIVMPPVFKAADMLQALDRAAGKKAANNGGLVPARAAATASD